MKRKRTGNIHHGDMHSYKQKVKESHDPLAHESHRAANKAHGMDCGMSPYGGYYEHGGGEPDGISPGNVEYD